MQNNTEYVQVVSGVENTHVEHDILTCELQHLVSDNRSMLLQFWLRHILFKIHSQRRSFK